MYLGNLANQQRKQAARAAADAAAAALAQQQAGGAGTGTVGPITVNLPAPPQPSIGDSLSGLFSNISPPVMIAGLAILGILLLKRR